MIQRARTTTQQKLCIRCDIYQPITEFTQRKHRVCTRCRASMPDSVKDPARYAREQYRNSRLMRLARIANDAPPPHPARARKCVKCKETKPREAFAGPRWRVCIACE